MDRRNRDHIVIEELPKQVKIDRNSWNASRMSYGENVGASCLYYGAHKDFCCWGFVALACNLSAERISGVSYLSNMVTIPHPRLSSKDIEKIVEEFKDLAHPVSHHVLGDVEGAIVVIQDHTEIDVEDKEHWIKYLFDKYYGVEIEFTGSHPYEKSIPSPTFADTV